MRTSKSSYAERGARRKKFRDRRPRTARDKPGQRRTPPGDRALPQYITIFRSELALIAGNAAAWDSIETGGELYGLLSRGGRIVVMLATPPGPNAVHKRAYFEQDLPHFRAVNLAMDDLGLQLQGRSHSHHILGMQHPSRGDKARLLSLAEKNNFRMMLSIVVTREEEKRPGSVWTRRGRIAGRWAAGDGGRQQTAGPVQVVNSFIFYPARRELVRCPVRVIHRRSPIRAALWTLSPEDRARLTFNTSPLRLDQVRWQTEETEETQARLPREVREELRNLPPAARERLRVNSTDKGLVAALPLPDGDTVYVGFRQNPPHRPLLVTLAPAEGGRPRPITEEVLVDGRETSMAVIYQAALRLREGAHKVGVKTPPSGAAAPVATQSPTLEGAGQGDDRNAQPSGGTGADQQRAGIGTMTGREKGQKRTSSGRSGANRFFWWLKKRKEVRPARRGSRWRKRHLWR